MAITPPKGLMEFPGVAQVERGSLTLLQGITPSVCTLEIQPQDPDTIPLDGDLRITFSPRLRTPIVFKACRIDKASFEYNEAGMVWRLNIYDRRWKWRFAGKYGPISAWFNQRSDSIQPAPTADDSLGTYQLGSLNPDSIMPPRQLAALLLDAMGEEDYDVSVLSNDIDSTPLPEMVWDYDLPAVALQELCDRLGCRVVLNLDNSVSVVQVGKGSPLPTTDIERESLVVDFPEIPESILVVGGRTRYQVDLLLCPVGLDVDGTIQRIWELSYAPTFLLPKVDGIAPIGTADNLGGWGLVMPDPEYGYQEIAGWETADVIPILTPENIQAAWKIGGKAPQVNPRYLARQTVWRWYQPAIKVAAPTIGGQTPDVDFPQLIPGWTLPGDSKNLGLEELWQILPLEDKQVLGWYDNVQQFRPYDALVYGQLANWTWDLLNGDLVEEQKLWDQDFNFAQPMPVPVNYSIDRERGVVMFEEPVFTYDSTKKQVWAPVLYLRTAVRPRFRFDPNTDHTDRPRLYQQAADHYTRERDLTDQGGKAGTGPRIIRREELVRSVATAYDKNHNPVARFDNVLSLDREADYAIDAALLEYQTPTPQDVTYMGIIRIQCDGAITQVSWNVGPEGATTRAARNTEVHYAVPTYRERVLIHSLARTTAATQAMQQQQRKA